MVKKKKKDKKKGSLKVLIKKKAKPKISKKKVGKKVKKVSKKVPKKVEKEDNFVVGFEEVIVTCASCGRNFRVVKSFGFSMDGMLCQRCASGGGTGFEGSDDF